MDEFGVSDSNFADASEILCDEREELIIKLMEKMEKNSMPTNKNAELSAHGIMPVIPYKY